MACVSITTRIFEAYLKCPTKCFLWSQGETGSGNEYADWASAQKTAYQEQAGRQLRQQIGTDSVSGPLDRKALRTATWRIATESKVCGHDLECTLHAVERAPSNTPGQPAQFIPTRFVLANKLASHDKLLLTFDALVLSEALGRKVAFGKIIHGADLVPLRVKTSALEGEVRRTIAKMARLLSGKQPPDVILNRHCAECEFQSRCRQKAAEKDDLSLLGGMTEKERTEFNTKGIFTVTQLSFTFRPRRRPKGLKDKRERYHYELKALAIREEKIHIVGTPEFKVEGTPVYLDVEGLPDRDFYYLVGVRTN